MDDILFAIVASLLLSSCGGNTTGQKADRASSSNTGGSGVVSNTGGAGGASGSAGRPPVHVPPIIDAAATDPNAGCPSQSCIDRAARVDSAMPAHMKPDGGTVVACCLPGGTCGTQISTVGVCIEARVLESVLFDASTGPTGPARPEWDGATPVCPITTPGGRVSGADCYVCIPSAAACGTLLQGEHLSAVDCAGIFSSSPDFHCEWYPDGVTINKPWGVQATCWSNPGRVICGGGL